MARYSIGIVGAGAIAREHAVSFAASSKVGTLHVHDVNAISAQAFADAFGAHVAGSLEALVHACDLVWICTPPQYHLEAVRAACAAGTAVFCEKPLARTPAEAREIAALVTAAGVPFFMGHSGRYGHAFRKLVRLVNDGAIGPPTMVWSTRQGYLSGPAAAPWRLDDETSGGLICELGVHEIDWIRWAGGDWASVSAVGSAKVLAPGRFQDTVCAVGTLANGTLARLDLSWANPRYVWQRGVTGETGALFFDDAAFHEVQLLRPGRKPRVIKTSPAGWQHAVTGENLTFRDQVREVLTALRRGTPPPVALADGLAAITVADAIRRSIATGARQTISERVDA